MLDVLRKIGKRLLTEIRPMSPEAQGLASLPRGAAGDRTHLIDSRAEEIILEGLRSYGKPITAISEEAGIVEINGGGTNVLIDPIDGSRNAVAGIPFYCTAIAVAQGKRLRDVELAYVINLANGDEFWAESGGGTFRNGVKTRTQEDEVFRLVAFDAHVPGRELPLIMPLLYEARKVRCFGSTALALAYLSSGGASIFAVPSLSRSFDFAAGWLLVREAGGIFTDIEGKDLSDVEFGLKHIATILASGNAGLHEKALAYLRSRR